MPRLAGNFGAVYVKISGTFTKVADVIDWEFKAGTKLFDVSIKMDPIDRFIPSHGEGVTFTAKRITEGAEVFPFFVGDSANNGTQTTWRLDLIDNNNLFTQYTVNGYAKTTSQNAPQGAGAEETIEIQIDDSWVVNV